MMLKFSLPLILILSLLAGCTATQEVDLDLPATKALPTHRVLTPLPPPDEYIKPLAPGKIGSLWANTGGDKVTRDELRASLDPTSVLNSVWDGTAISLFAGRNEVLAFNLVLEAPAAVASEITLNLAHLAGPDGARIETNAGPGSDPFDFVGRNIELFYIRYLEIKGLSTDLFIAGYDYDERHIPERCRRPLDPESSEPSGGWEDRPCHNLLYPEIAVPLELHTPFDIPAGANQSIWGDIYIPKDSPPGTYSGLIEIREKGVLTWQVPVSLQVHDFTLPDLPAARTMLYLSAENIADRYLGDPGIASESKGDTLLLHLIDSHFQLAHRHKISLIGDYVPVDQLDETWRARLNGDLFTPDRGYDGPGVGVGNNVFSIGTYGNWPWQGGTREDMWAASDAWVGWFNAQAFATPTEFFLYLIDESDDYDQIEEWAGWIDANPGPGQDLMALATLDLPEANAYVPSLDIPASWASFDITAEWQAALAALRANPGKRFYLYNSNRPATGSFAIEDEGVALRQVPWAQHKMGVDRWFYWEATYYANYQCYGDDNQALTNVFQQAQTYGCLDDIDDSLGETGWNYLNGDGVLFYPGTEARFPVENYGLPGPLASLRLKHWRRGIQDVDYLVMAARVDPERTRQIVQELVPVVLWEVGVSDPEDPTFVYADISWPIDPDIWEAARKELANLITGTTP